MNVRKEKVVLTLTAQVMVEYSEVIEVDSDITPEQLKQLKAMRRRDVEIDAYTVDNDSFNFDRATIEEMPAGLDAEYDAVARVRDGEVWFHPVAKSEVNS